MRRIACLAALTAATLLPAAGASAWVPQATYDVPGGAPAACLRAADPGEVTLLGTIGRSSTTIDLLRLDGGGFAPVASTDLGWLATCPAVAAAPGAATLLAAPVVTRRARSIRRPAQTRVHVAAAGASAQALGPQTPFGLAGPPVVATNAAGDAAVAWTETEDVSSPVRLFVAQRAAGAPAFGAPAMVAADLASLATAPVALGIDGYGRATVSWIAETGARRHPWELRVADSQSGGGFGPAQSVGEAAGTSVALAVAANGRALLGVAAGDLYERAPGQDAFTAVTDDGFTGFAQSLSVAINADGAAIAASDNGLGEISARTRPAGGRFGRWTRLTRGPEQRSGLILAVGYGAGDGPGVPLDPQGTDVSASITASGRVAVTWVDIKAAVPAAYAAAGTAVAGLGGAARLSGRCLPVNGARPVVLADGRLSVAWTDNARTASYLSWSEAMSGGRLHVAVAGPPPRAPTPAAPGLSATVLNRRPLRIGDPLRVRVRCRTAACAVRASAKTTAVASPWWTPARGPSVASKIAKTPDHLLIGSAAGTAQLPAGGSSVLRLDTLPSTTFVTPNRTARHAITVSACTPQGALAQRVIIHPRLRGGHFRPMPTIVAAHAVRRGRAVDIRWRTDRAVHGYVAVQGLPGQAGPGRTDTVVGARRRFHSTLSPGSGPPLTRVRLQVHNADGLAGPPQTIRVR